MKSVSTPLRLVYGVCGIGLGHSFRQLPLIENYLHQNCKICVFAYGRSLEFFKKRFKSNESVLVEEVAVPFYAGNERGLDFSASARHRANHNIDFLGINCKAMDRASSFVGKPNLVISDYEPVAADYAYAYNAPLVTIDQQSKYLCKSEWPELSGFRCQDEVMRLRMLFPKAEKRIATSFFQVEVETEVEEQVELHGPVIRGEVLAFETEDLTGRENSILVYVSSQQAFSQSLEEVLEVFASFDSWHFDVYTSEKIELYQDKIPKQIRLRRHGDSRFLDSLRKCKAVISTAGHTLLSEAMYLGKPVLTVPLPVYEQHMNALVLDRHGFGMSVSEVNCTTVKDFLCFIPDGVRAIASDTSVLLRTAGQLSIIDALKSLQSHLLLN